jgi:hypothetical protein
MVSYPAGLFIVQSDFRYQQLLMHESAVSLQRAHNGPNTYLEVFSIKGMAGGEPLLAAAWRRHFAQQVLPYTCVQQHGELLGM